LNCHYFFLLRLKITVCPGTTSCNLGGILTFTPLFLYNPLSLLHNLSPCLLSLTLCFLVDSLASWKVNRQSCERKKKCFKWMEFLFRLTVIYYSGRIQFELLLMMSTTYLLVQNRLYVWHMIIVHCQLIDTHLVKVLLLDCKK
jgi:hypothetical protein